VQWNTVGSDPVPFEQFEASVLARGAFTTEEEWRLASDITGNWPPVKVHHKDKDKVDSKEDSSQSIAPLPPDYI
jgi:hypothetical protein